MKRSIYILFALAVATCAHAATFTWTGGGSTDNWADGANWSGGAPPANDGTADIIIDQSVHSSTVSGTWNVKSLTSASGAELTFSGATSNSSLRVSGATSGGFRLINAGNLALTLTNGSGVTNYSASQGTLEAVGSSGLGNATITIDHVASLGLSGGGTIANASLRLGSIGIGAQKGLYSLSGPNSFLGSITLTGDSSIGAASASWLNLTSAFGTAEQTAITGTGDLHIEGAGVVSLYKQLRHDGDVHVYSGTVQVGNNAAYTGNYIVRPGARLESNATNLTDGSGGVTVMNGGTLAVLNSSLNEAVTVSGNGVNGLGAITLNNFYGERAASLGSITLAGDTRIGLYGDNSYTDSYANRLTNVGGTGNVEFVGNGTVNLFPGNSYDGTTTIAMTGGHVRIDDLAAFGSSSTPIVVKGGTLDLRDTEFFYYNQQPVIIGGTREIHLDGGRISGSLYTLNAGVHLLSDSTIDGTNATLAGAITGNGRRLTLTGSNLQLTGHVDLGSGGLTIGSNAQVILATNLDSTSPTVVQGTLREAVAGALTAAGSLQLNGNSLNNNGILELGGGDYQANIGTGDGEVQWTGSGGFAAHGAARTVNLGGAGATLVWGTNGFVGSGAKLKLGRTDSTSAITFANGVDLNGQTRTVTYASSPTTIGQVATLSGAVSNGTLRVERTSGLGYLALTGTNSFSGLQVAGHVRAEGAALPISANIALAGGTLLRSQNFSHGLGTGAGQVQWTASGGFAAVGQDVTVNLAPATLTWGSGGFVPDGQMLLLGHASATHKLTLADNLALGSTARTIRVTAGTGVDAVAAITGNITGASDLNIQGSGVLQLSGSNTFTNLVIQSGTVETSAAPGNTGTANAVGNGKIMLNGGTYRYTGGSASSNRFGASSLGNYSSGIAVAQAATDLNVTSAFTSTSPDYALIKTGPGALSLSGSTSNTDLTVDVREGRLDLEKTGSAYAVQDLIVRGGTARLNDSSTNLINGGLTINSGAFEMNGRNESVEFVTSNSIDPPGQIRNGSSTAARLTITEGFTYQRFFSGSLVNGGTGSLGITVTGGFTGLSGTNTYSGSTNIQGGELAFMNAASVSPNSNIILDSFGALTIGFDWAPTLGTGAGQLRWNTNAFDAALASAATAGASLSIGGAANPATLKFGTTNFVRDNYGLVFGSETARGTLNLRNPLDLNAKSQILGVNNSSSTNIEGEISGVISNGTGLRVAGMSGPQTFTGNYSGGYDLNIGRLRLSANNTFDGLVSIDRAGVVIDRIGNVGSGAGPLGMATTAAKGAISLGSYGELRYMGTGHSTNRDLYLGIEGTYGPASTTNALIAEGTGALVWNGDITNLYTGGTQQLILGGTSLAANTVGGDILPFSASTDSLEIFKQDTGTWVLTGNTNLKNLFISGGRLELRGNHNFTQSWLGLGTYNGGEHTLAIGGNISTNAASFEINVSEKGTLEFTSGANYSHKIQIFTGSNSAPNNQNILITKGTSTFSGETALLNSYDYRIVAAAGATAVYDRPGSNAAITSPNIATPNLTLGGAGNFVFNDAIQLKASSKFTYGGTGTLDLNAANTFGAVLLSGGRTNLNFTGGLGSGPVEVGTAALLVIAQGVTQVGDITLRQGGELRQAFASGTQLSGTEVNLALASGVIATARIRAGTLGTGGELSLSFGVDPDPEMNGLRAILDLSGTGSSIIALSLQSQGGAGENSFLGWWSEGHWKNAVAGNSTSGLLAGSYEMSWDAFAAANSSSTLADMLGAYGRDETSGETWAVIDHNSQFTSVPEPGSALLLVAGLAGMALRRRRLQRSLNS